MARAVSKLGPNLGHLLRLRPNIEWLLSLGQWLTRAVAKVRAGVKARTTGRTI